MKKTKVIIPALGILVLSTAASITGTVAWFTANTKYNTTVGDFAVVKTNSDMAVDLTAGVGTQVSGDPEVVSVKSNYELTDASFDHVTSGYYIYAPDATGTVVASKTTLAAAKADEDALLRTTYQVSSTTHKVYSAFTFDISFTVTFSGVDRNYGLFMDHQAGKSSVVKAAGGAIAATDTIKGFRMAFVGTSENAETKIWADNQSETHTVSSETVYDVQYVSDLAVGATLAGTHYASPALIDADYASASFPSSNSPMATADADDRPDYLGKFVKPNSGSTATLSYTVVCWFEGTDPTIVNTATVFDTVRANLYFESVALAD